MKLLYTHITGLLDPVEWNGDKLDDFIEFPPHYNDHL